MDGGRSGVAVTCRSSPSRILSEKGHGTQAVNNMKIFLFGRRINGRYDSLKCFMGRLFKRLLKIGYFGVAGFLIFQAGGAFNPSVHFVQAEKEAEERAPVLSRIFDCESGTRDKHGRAVKGSATHYDKNGQVLMRANTNGTVDVGISQINSVNFPEATRLGLDVTKERDNIAFAEILYKTQGTEPWYSSKSCWR